MISKDFSKEKALSKAQNICAKQEKCRADIRQKLYDWKVDPHSHKWILENLVKNKFIDEERYVDFFVRDKFKLNKWGKVKIEYALHGKQIASELIQHSLQQINKNDYVATCKGLIVNKLKTLKEKDTQKLKEKLLRFVQSRGFEASLAYKLVEELVLENR